MRTSNLARNNIILQRRNSVNSGKMLFFNQKNQKSFEYNTSLCFELIIYLNFLHNISVKTLDRSKPQRCSKRNQCHRQRKICGQASRQLRMENKNLLQCFYGKLMNGNETKKKINLNENVKSC